MALISYVIRHSDGQSEGKNANLGHRNSASMEHLACLIESCSAQCFVLRPCKRYLYQYKALHKAKNKLCFRDMGSLRTPPGMCLEVAASCMLCVCRKNSLFRTHWETLHGCSHVPPKFKYTLFSPSFWADYLSGESLNVHLLRFGNFGRFCMKVLHGYKVFASGAPNEDIVQKHLT